jgi:hypothetical protein
MRFEVEKRGRDMIKGRFWVDDADPVLGKFFGVLGRQPGETSSSWQAPLKGKCLNGKPSRALRRRSPDFPRDRSAFVDGGLIPENAQASRRQGLKQPSGSRKIVPDDN